MQNNSFKPITEKEGISNSQIVMAPEEDNNSHEKSLLKKGCINIFISMPCPLKTPFQQLFKPFVKKWNEANPNLLLNWPSITDCSPEGIEGLMTTATIPDELPDIFITGAYNIIFSEPFYSRFIKTGLFGGIPHHYYPDSYPSNIVDASSKYGIGFLGFSSWGLVRDLSVKGDFPVPQQLSDLAKPEFEQLFSIHGCHGHAASLTMLMELKREGGDEAIKQFADNTKKVRHFAELIKNMGTLQSETPYYILPYVSVANIPSSKKTEIINLDGGIITSLMMVVNQEKIDSMHDILEFFTGNEFQELIQQSAYFQPDSTSRIDKCSFSDLKMLSQLYYNKVQKLGDLFIDFLGDKIK